MDGKITILIEGKPVGLKFAFPCVRWFSEESQKQPDIYFIETDRGPSMTDYGLAKLMQCAYRNQCLLSEVNPDIKFEKFVEFVESKNNQEGAEELGRIMTVYAESSVSKRVVESSEKKSPPLKEMTAA